MRISDWSSDVCSSDLPALIVLDVPGRDVEDYERWGVAPAITIGIDSPTSLTLQGEYLDDKAIPQYGIRYFPALRGIVDQFDRSGYYGFANLDRQDRKTQTLPEIERASGWERVWW